MEKAREFRTFNNGVTKYHSVEEWREHPVPHKLEFLRCLKRWYDQRIHYAPPFDPMKKRQEMIHFCRLRGFYVTFPPWIQAPDEESAQSVQANKSPEFLTLVEFL